MNAIHRRHKARQDLWEIFRYYAREAGLALPRRSFAQLKALLPVWRACLAWTHTTTSTIRHSLTFVSSPSLASACTWSSTGLSPAASRLSVSCTARATSPASWQRNLAWIRLPTRNRKKSQTSPDRKSPDPAAAHHRHRPYV